ncbi:phage terminase large subunit [Methylobacterium sp. AMS5]|uniref:phage terminase large subunit n=1 Tax=Methylobacterium sp. AMS5 TaxID=925818 RepID=UPI00074FA267|nr:phage terminase large subunit [Methylobacterium sp. AMS5]AMB48274.1 terminase [Methylobacterium sp. AMS5]
MATLEYKLHHGQATVFNDPRRVKVVVAGRRWGKTQFARISIVTAAAAKSKQKVWYVAPTYGMARSILWDELKDSIPAKWVKRINETRMAIRLRNGSLIECKGADKPDSLRGVALHLVVVDEAQDIEPDTWFKVLMPTLASTRGSAIIIGTPKAYNWLYDVYMKGQRGDTYRDAKGKLRRNTHKSWQFPTITSPFIPLEEIENARQNMDDKSFRQEFEASFETMSGRVYHAFDRNIHVGDYAFNPQLPIWIGQDFNIDPMSSVIMQLQDNGEVWIVGEIILPGSSTEEVAQELDRKFFKHKKRIILYPDPAGAQRGHGRGESDLDILRDAEFKNLKYRKKHPKVADRVNSVNRMLKAADGTIRLKVDRNCKHVINAFEQTIYKPGSRDVDKSAGVEHPADALGYCLDLEFPVRQIKILGVSL